MIRRKETKSKTKQRRRKTKRQKMIYTEQRYLRYLLETKKQNNRTTSAFTHDPSIPISSHANSQNKYLISFRARVLLVDLQRQVARVSLRLVLV